WFIGLLVDKKNWQDIFWSMSITLSAAVLSIALVFGIVKFPYPQPTAAFDLSLLSERAGKISGEAGVSSRWNLLPP
ncbi:hypothetical protein COU01_02675, partial [Candidatus Falkowbacteria bacterium CG10_big_fil_rev_8_21_14_0_10_44_15]